MKRFCIIQIGLALLVCCITQVCFASASEGQLRDDFDKVKRLVYEVVKFNQNFSKRSMSFHEVIENYDHSVWIVDIGISEENRKIQSICLVKINGSWQITVNESSTGILIRLPKTVAFLSKHGDSANALQKVWSDIPDYESGSMIVKNFVHYARLSDPIQKRYAKELFAPNLSLMQQQKFTGIAKTLKDKTPVLDQEWTSSERRMDSYSTFDKKGKKWLVLVVSERILDIEPVAQRARFNARWHYNKTGLFEE